jgi:putative Mg2+ transporter-C (MgtC) family protein
VTTVVLQAAWEPTGQGWAQVLDLLLAFVLASVIGFEREMRQKSAGLRTHALVGVGSALFVLVSKYGFTDVLGQQVILDPSRVAAQIVSGIGFIGGGIIFVRRDVVSGLTTAASIWLTAAVGAAAGAGLPLLAVLATGLFLAAVPGYSALVRHLPRELFRPSPFVVSYRDGEGVLRSVLAECTQRGFAVHHLASRRGSRGSGPERAVVTVWLQLVGRGSESGLAVALSEVPGVISVEPEDADAP